MSVIKGKFLGATDKQDVGKENKQYWVRSFFLDITDDIYPNTPEFHLAGDNCNLVDGLNPGDEIEVFYNIKGKKYTSRKTDKDGVFTKLECWKIGVGYKADPAPAQEPQTNNDPLPF